MARSIRSYPQSDRRMVVNRRIESQTYGLGYWAARDYDYAVIVREAKKHVFPKQKEK